VSFFVNEIPTKFSGLGVGEIRVSETKVTTYLPAFKVVTAANGNDLE
jgi:hypothetical protein